MPSRIFLSPLRADQTTLPTPPAGRWSSLEDFLRMYSSDIHIEGDLADHRAVHSVPTAFARPIQFYQALEQERHPSHHSIKGQWRGLLAIFALQRWLNLTLDADEFRLPSAEAVPDLYQRADGALLAILRGQLPQPTSEWERWWLLRSQGKLLGATSPWSLVYTPAHSKCPDFIPWCRNGVLIDPLDYYDPDRRGGGRELALLSGWLERVMDGERERWGVADRTHLEQPLRTIVRHLQKWRAELSRYADAALPRISLQGTANLVREAPYNRFLVPLDTRDIRAQSDLVLARTRGEGEVLIFSRRGMASHLRVHGPILAGQLDFGAAALHGPDRAAGWRTPAGQEIPLPYLIAEEAFFPRKLARLDLSGDAYQVDTEAFALPLTPLFFRYFHLQDLLDGNLLVEVGVEQDRVIARLRLPLTSGGVLDVEKAWDRKRDVTEIHTPGLAYWPDFVADDWHYNYAFLASAPDTKLSVRPLLLDGGTLPSSQSEGVDASQQVWQSDRPILGFALEVAEDAGGEPQSAGLVVRRFSPPAQQHGEGTWQVAVDFGTSNTHIVVLRDSAAEAVPLALRARKRSLTRPVASYKLQVDQTLFEAQEVVPDFPTLLGSFSGSLLTGGSNGNVRREAYFPHFFYYKSSLKGFVRDLKWASRGGTQSEGVLREYLGYLVQAVACEARAAGVRRIEFEWSFPLALPVGTRVSMEGFWSGEANELVREAGLEARAGNGVSESEAVCRFFAQTGEMPIMADSLSIALDIGGGSTDIGFWSASKLLDQLSFKLGGNDLLVPLLNLPDFLTDLLAVCEPGGGGDVGEVSSMAFLNPEAYLNGLLLTAARREGEGRLPLDPWNHPVPRALTTKLAQGEAPWVVARSLFYLYAMGVFFYLGVHARRWLPDLELSDVTIALGGRGVALLSWITEPHRLERILLEAFRDGMQLDLETQQLPDVRLKGPGLPRNLARPLKSEVATGLLAPDAFVGERPARPDRVVVGEEGWRDGEGKPLAWDSMVKVGDLQTLKPPPNHNSGFAAHLLNQVLPRYTEELSLDGIGLAEIDIDSASVQDYLRRTSAVGLGVLQPVFAVELRSLMERYLDRRLAR